MPHAKLHPIAAIAKMLDQPESTLHYWKNRFSDFLGGVGQGRGRRFTSQSVEVFRDIAALMDAGMSVASARQELHARHGEAAPADARAGKAATRRTGKPGALAETSGAGREACAEELAMRIGAAMAEAVGERLQALLANPGAHGQEPRHGEAIQALTEALARASRELDGLLRANESISGKMGVLEAELVRLRKDRRELEKHLLEKIKTLRQG